MVIRSSTKMHPSVELALGRSCVPVFVSFSPSGSGIIIEKRLSTLARLIRESMVDEVVVEFPYEGPDLDELARYCAETGVTFRLLVQLPITPTGEPRAAILPRGACLLSIETVPHARWMLVVKRLIDIAGALMGLAFCVVLYLWYAHRIHRETGASALFRQTRVGLNGRAFTLYKFRSMYGDAEMRLSELLDRNEMRGCIFKLRDDPRVTRLGRKLRSSHLDEVPQFWNVLKGEMSLVGTRPPTPEEVERYEPRHRRRLSMRPGITGPWQILGNAVVEDFDEVVRLDCDYIDEWSLWLDLKLITKTVLKMLHATGW